MGAALQVDRSAFRLANVIDAEQVESGGAVEAAANGRQKSCWLAILVAPTTRCIIWYVGCLNVCFRYVQW